MRFRSLLALGAIGLGLSSYGQERKVEFSEFTLDNGLHVILHEDHSTPIVAVTVLYHVGSKNENPERTGFAHFFEHLLFEGSQNIDRGEYDNYVESNGGVLNANTSQDRTFYFEMLPSNQLELGLWLESERMLHAKVEQVGIETQREVVKEEKRQRMDNQPYGSFMAEMFKRAYKVHPYRWIPIGSMEHIDAAQEDDYVNFYKTFYVPNNATLSIAGDIDVEQAKKWINAYFGGIPSGEKLNVYRDMLRMDETAFVSMHMKDASEKTVAAFKADRAKEDADPLAILNKYFKNTSSKPIPVPQPKEVEPALGGEVRDVIIDENAPIPAIFMGYRLPGQDSEDFYAVQMLNMALSQGQSSRLNKSLVDEKELAMMAVAFPFPLEDPGIGVMLAGCKPGVELKTLEDAVTAEVTQLQTEMISEEEFQTVRNQIEADFITSNSTMSGIAESLANYHTYFGDANLINEELKRYMKVTREDIQRVAKKYFTNDNRVVLHYVSSAE